MESVETETRTSIRKEAVAELLRLPTKAGVLEPAAVVDYARDPDTALHAYFDWEDSVAAEKWRIEQARRIIRSVHVRLDVTDKLQVRVVQFVEDSEIEAARYLARDKADPSAVMKQELARCLGVLERARDLALSYNDPSSAKLARLVRSVADLLTGYE